VFIAPLILGCKATIVKSLIGAYMIGMIEAGLVATGMQGFWVRAVVGLVFLAAVIFHLTMDEPGRLARLRQMLRLGGRCEPQPAPGSAGNPKSGSSGASGRSTCGGIGRH
jgi:hypothetical protein